jgi:hypothetical protein
LGAGVSFGGAFSGFFFTTSFVTSAFVSAFTDSAGGGRRPFARSFFLFPLLCLLRASSRSLGRLGISTSFSPSPRPSPRRGEGRVRGTFRNSC